MKSLKFLVWAQVIVSLFLVSCSDSNSTSLDEEDVPSHFDIWVSVSDGNNYSTLVKGVKSLEEQANIDFVNDGADVTSKLYDETIIKGKYYYQVPTDKDRFGKYQIKNNNYSVVAEFPFQNNTLKDRRYTHAWLDANTLVLIGSNGASDKILWIKVDAETMYILDEGELDLPIPAEGDKFNTSGIARGRNGQVIYTYVYSKVKTKFYTAFFNGETMKREGEVVEEDRASFMAGTAYGELLQNKTFMTPNGDYYIACNTVNEDATSYTQQHGTLLRIKNGENRFDPSYKGCASLAGKLITVDCLNNDIALIYVQDPTFTGAAGWGSDYNCYYALLNLKTDEIKEIQYNGRVLPYSSGTFSQRSLVYDGKVYIGVNPKDEQPAIYIYDLSI